MRLSAREADKRDTTDLYVDFLSGKVPDTDGDVGLLLILGLKDGHLVLFVLDERGVVLVRANVNAIRRDVLLVVFGGALAADKVPLLRQCSNQSSLADVGRSDDHQLHSTTTNHLFLPDEKQQS